MEQLERARARRAAAACGVHARAATSRARSLFAIELRSYVHVSARLHARSPRYAHSTGWPHIPPRCVALSGAQLALGLISLHYIRRPSMRTLLLALVPCFLVDPTGAYNNGQPRAAPLGWNTWCISSAQSLSRLDLIILHAFLAAAVIDDIGWTRHPRRVWSRRLQRSGDQESRTGDGGQRHACRRLPLHQPVN